MSKKAGGPAFPTTKENRMVVCSEGMTLRDYFAAKAMQAVLTGLVTKSERPVPTSLADLSYTIADDMMVARKE